MFKKWNSETDNGNDGKSGGNGVKSAVVENKAEGEVPAVRVGGAIRIPRAAWDEWGRRKAAEALGSVIEAPAQEQAAIHTAASEEEDSST